MANIIESAGGEQKTRTKLNAAQMQCIDGLRAVAVLIVIIQHYKVAFAGPHGIVALLTTPGASGVMLFFVISGLCITLSKTERISWQQFYIRRALRLLPALYVSMILILLANHFILRNQLKVTDFVGVALSLPHYFSSLLNINAPLWSLQTEIELYLLFPIMLFLFLRTSRQIFLILSTAITLGAYGVWYVTTPQFTYFPPFSAFCHVIVWNLGLLLAYGVLPAPNSAEQRRTAPNSAEQRRTAPLALAQACTVLGLGFVCLLLRNKELTNVFAFWYLLVGYGY